jgi:hypothetical protein
MLHKFNKTICLRFGCVVIAAVITYLISQVVFWDSVLTTDEHAYVTQAFTFSEGKISRPVPPLPEIFIHEMMIMDEDAGWLSRYPPAHSIWLIPGVIFDSPHLMISLAAALSVWIFSSAGMVLKLHPVLSSFLMLWSPYFLLMNGTLLSHTSALPASCLMLWAYLSWKVEKKNIYALLAGLAWSWLFLNRTYTGLLIAFPFALDALWDLSRNRSRHSFYGTVLFVVSSAGGVVVYLTYNFLAVGDPLMPTYLYYAPNDGLGFGWRSTSSLPYYHTFSTGLAYLQENMLLLNRWLFGFPGSLLLAAVLALIGWRRRWSFLCLAVTLSVAFGYVFFWWRGVRDVGPVYYFEVLPFILLPATFGIQRIFQRFAPRPMLRSVLITAGSLLLVFSSLSFMYQQGRLLRERQRIVGEYHHFVKTAPEKSLIMVTGFKGMRHVEKGTSFNPRGINSDPLLVFAGDIPPAMISQAYPDRDLYWMVFLKGHLALVPFSPER